MQDHIPAGRGERTATLGRSDGLVIRTHDGEMDDQSDRDPSQTARVVEGGREGLSLAQIR
jgi:hypothetical protein